MQSVFPKGASQLGFAQLIECAGQSGRRQQDGRVVWAEYPEAASQGVLAQGARPLSLAQRD